MDNASEKKSVAVVLPCFNEQETISEVVRSFHATLPNAVIYVFDNNSTDNTADEAIKAGAVVYKVQRRGKDNVVRAIIRDVNADFYIMADGDGTYPADSASEMLDMAITKRADVFIGNRLPSYAGSYSRAGHQ
jgi:glycosyltransferase involved in cell wall biosynthesis